MTTNLTNGYKTTLSCENDNAKLFLKEISLLGVNKYKYCCDKNRILNEMFIVCK